MDLVMDGSMTLAVDRGLSNVLYLLTTLLVPGRKNERPGQEAITAREQDSTPH